MNLDVRQPVHPSQGKTFDTTELRKHFLVERLFVPGEINLTYSHFDRIIVGGACPAGGALSLEGGKALAADHFLQRRELGVINIGAAGSVNVDGTRYPLAQRDGMYVGMGAERVSFESDDTGNPAKFYMASVPAHHVYPTTLVDLTDAREVKLGTIEESNKRTIHQFVHPEVLRSCQLAMGMTILEPGCVWNTMPCHTHDRRMEVYCYFDMAEDTRVFHLMGPPAETRHIVVKNEQAVISPSWSIHSGVGTAGYTFIWAMVGENQEFTDMDHVAMADLR